MPQQEALDLCGSDVLAAHLHHVFEAAGESQAAVLVERAEVAGSEEAVCVEHLGVAFRVVVVPVEHRPSLVLDLADLAGWGRSSPDSGSTIFTCSPGSGRPVVFTRSSRESVTSPRVRNEQASVEPNPDT